MKRQGLLLAGIAALLVTTSSGLGAMRTSAAAPAHSGAALKGTITIFDWGAFGGPPPPPIGSKVLKAYEKMHPGVTIKTVPLPPGDATVWEESNLAAGTAPDILAPSYTQQVFSDLGKNYWLDLTSYLQMPNHYVKGNKHWIDIYDPTVNIQNAFEGNKYYIISWEAQDATFFYNKDIFAKVGIKSTPTTWAQLLSDEAKLKKAGYIANLYFLGDTYPIGENGSIMSWIESQVMGKTFQKLDTDHNGIVDIKELVNGIKHKIYSPLNPDYQEAWKIYKGWSQYWEPNASGLKGPYLTTSSAAMPPFAQQKAAIVYNAQWLGNYLTSVAKVKFHWGVFKMPRITTASSKFASDAQPGVGIWGAWNAVSYGIPVATQKRGHLALALDFLQWITAPQNDVPVTLEGSNFPVTKGYQPSGDFNSTFYSQIKHPTMQFAAEATLGPEWLRDRIATQQNYILGVESLQQAMADMQRYTDQAVAKVSKIYHL